MKKLISITLLTMLCGVSVTAIAQTKAPETGATPMNNGVTRKDSKASGDSLPMAAPAKAESGGVPMANPANKKDKMMMTQNMDFNVMDANGDGYVSRTEYMKYHEANWGMMKKSSKGMVSMQDMQAAGNSR